MLILKKAEGKTIFIEEANNHHPTKFTAEISAREINVLDTTVYKGKGFLLVSVINANTHFKPAETFQYTHFSIWGKKKLQLSIEDLRLLKTP